MNNDQSFMCSDFIIKFLKSFSFLCIICILISPVIYRSLKQNTKLCISKLTLLDFYCNFCCYLANIYRALQRAKRGGQSGVGMKRHLIVGIKIGN